MTETSIRDIIAYLVWRTGCIHPFRISRILVLANWRAIEERGTPIAKFGVQGFEAGFYIEGVKEIIEEDKCFKINEEKKCIEYYCQPPKIPEEHSRILDKVLEQTKNLSDRELNRLVTRDPRYRELLEKGGFT